MINKFLYKYLICAVLCVSIIASTCTAVFAEDEQMENNFAAAVYESLEYDADKGVTHSSETAYGGSLYGAVEFVNASPYYSGIVLSENTKLDRNITLYSLNDTTGFILIDGNVELDLSGCFITQLSGSRLSRNPLFIIPKNSSLTIKDTSEKQSGSINAVQYTIQSDGGELTIEGGCIMAQSNASLFPDNCELPISLHGGGTLNMTGGKIDYSGELEDGRLYSERSCAVYADESSFVNISGGTVCGGIDADKRDNLTVRGGSFRDDVSDIISAAYECVLDGKYYSVKQKTPSVSAEYNGESVLAELKVLSEYASGEPKDYSVRSVSENGTRDNARIEISEVLRAAQEFGYSNSAAVNIETDIAEFKFDAETVRKIAAKYPGGKIYLNVEKSDADDEVLRQLSTAKIEVTYSFTDEDGAALDFDGSFNVKIPYLSRTVEKNILLYNMSDGKLSVDTAAKYSDNAVSYTANGFETVLIAEGSGLIIQGKALDLQGTISLVFYATVAGVDTDSVRMLFWDEPQSEYTEDTAARVVETSGKTGYGYKFEYKNISSKDMNKKVYARLTATDNTGKKIYSDVPTEGYSVVSYAENMMSNEKIKPLLVKMLNYGAAAQEYFGSSDPPANDILTDGEKATDYTKIYSGKAQTISENAGAGMLDASIKGKTLILDGDISINYYTQWNGAAGAEEGMLFWNENDFNNTALHTLGTQTFSSQYYEDNGGYRVYAYPNIVSGAMNEQVYARLYRKTADGHIFYSDIDSYSVRDYAANQLSRDTDKALVKLLRTLMLYGDEAEKYFKGAIS